MLRFLNTTFVEKKDGMHCIININEKPDYVEKRVENRIINTRNHFLKYIHSHSNKTVYTGFCPKSVYGQNLLTGKKQAYRKAYSELHGINLEKLNDLKKWAESAAEAVDNAIKIEKHDMDSVRYWVEKGVKTK